MISIAIDGPAGAGKSTIAKAAAKALKFIYVDTGALYRTIALAALRKKTVLSDIEDVKKLLSGITVSIKFIDNNQRVFLNNEDVSDLIRTSEISNMASDVSKIPIVREYLLELQRGFAEKNNVIMDGRDIGTVVLPNAQLKIFLTASAEVRAKRRFDQLAEQGIHEDYNEILNAIKTRDYNDSHRDIAPLKPAENAVIIDTSEETLEQSVNRLTELMKGCL